MTTLNITIVCALAGVVLLFVYLMNKKAIAHQKNISVLENEVTRLKTNNTHLLSDRDNLAAITKKLYEQNNELRVRLSEEQTKLSASEESIAAIQNSMQDNFKLLAAQVMEEKSQKFDQHTQQVLNPLQEEVKRLQQKVQEAYDNSQRNQLDLQVELRKMQELNNSLQKESQNLTKALKGNSKKQGDWGEMILERVLEASGLEKGREFETQISFTTEDNGRLRPDAIVYLPDNKCVIIDSKVSLIAYDQFVSAEEAGDTSNALKAHVDSVKTHIDELSKKDYAQKLKINTPEYVLMFIPIESAFSVAAQSDTTLFQYAWNKNVVIVTPTTLMATLATINYMWKQEKQTVNAIRIAECGGKLYDKLVGFLVDMDNLGKQLDGAKNSFDNAVGKLKNGRGNVVRQAENLRTLGVKSTKALGITKIGSEALLEDPKAEIN